ncbi:hypothetical protein EG327_008272 [Venturia inaequalis]|uniref:BTB domain-containing protein n=1 Tax=Venturia inaequalis TaxID=5025 RepID=A0A8H3VQH5_VENIN|nr:hypothetical protein EG327_008272 [Venturia inaequalis]
MAAPMELDDPARNLKTFLSNKLTSGEFSDLTIKCGGKKFSVHKVIVCSQSPVLHNACKKGGFKESETGVIDLPDDDLALVEAMINFMYTFRYGSTDPNEHQPLLFDANVFALADKYDVSGFRQAAVMAFKVKLGTDSIDEFVEAVPAIYTNTPPSVMELRTTAVNFAKMQLKVLAKTDAFMVMMDSVGAFGKDLVRSIACEMERGPNQTGNIQFTCNTEFCKLRTMVNLYNVGYAWQRFISWTDNKRQYIRCPQCMKDTYANTSLSNAAFVDDSWFAMSQTQMEMRFSIQRSRITTPKHGTLSHLQRPAQCPHTNAVGTPIDS